MSNDNRVGFIEAQEKINGFTNPNNPYNIQSLRSTAEKVKANSNNFFRSAVEGVYADKNAEAIIVMNNLNTLVEQESGHAGTLFVSEGLSVFGRCKTFGRDITVVQANKEIQDNLQAARANAIKSTEKAKANKPESRTITREACETGRIALKVLGFTQLEVDLALPEYTPFEQLLSDIPTCVQASASIKKACQDFVKQVGLGSFSDENLEIFNENIGQINNLMQTVEEKEISDENLDNQLVRIPGYFSQKSVREACDIVKDNMAAAKAAIESIKGELPQGVEGVLKTLGVTKTTAEPEAGASTRLQGQETVAANPNTQVGSAIPEFTLTSMNFSRAGDLEIELTEDDRRRLSAEENWVVDPTIQSLSSGVSSNVAPTSGAADLTEQELNAETVAWIKGIADTLDPIDSEKASTMPKASILTGIVLGGGLSIGIVNKAVQYCGVALQKMAQQAADQIINMTPEVEYLFESIESDVTSSAIANSTSLGGRVGGLVAQYPALATTAAIAAVGGTVVAGTALVYRAVQEGIIAECNIKNFRDAGGFETPVVVKDDATNPMAKKFPNEAVVGYFEGPLLRSPEVEQTSGQAEAKEELRRQLSEFDSKLQMLTSNTQRVSQDVKQAIENNQRLLDQEAEAKLMEESNKKNIEQKQELFGAIHQDIKSNGQQKRVIREELLPDIKQFVQLQA